MVNLKGLTDAYATRALERLIPLPSLYRLKRASLGFRNDRLGLSRIPPEATLPPFFNRSQPVCLTTIGVPLQYHLNCEVSLFPDRLSLPRWQERCSIAGIEPVKKLVAEKRPIILAFCHFGVYQLMGYWLRALGLPVATIVTGESEKRSQLNILKSKWSPFPNMQDVFHQDELAEMIRFLKSGKPLLVALDAPSGTQLDVPLCDGWFFKTAAGGLRLAARHDAELIFCSMIETGPWQFHFEFGRPVPRELLKDKNDLIPAAKHLLDEWLVLAKKYPEQLSPKKLCCFTGAVNPNEIADPEKITAR